MYDSPAVSLVPLPSTAITAARVEPGAADAAVMCGFAFTSMLSVVLFLAGMPLISMGVLALTGVSTLVVESALASRRRQHSATADPAEAIEVPEVVVALETRDTYRAIVNAYFEIRRTFDDSAALRTSQAAVLERCDAAVRQCSRMALLSNPLQRYLDAHDRAQAVAELERLRARVQSANDAAMVESLGRAATARERQLETREQIAGMRDRIQARLELVRAALESFSATIVKLRVAGEEQMLLSGESVIDHLDGVGEELEVLETELAMDLAA